MTISILENKVTIVGNVKSISHFQEIKTALDSLVTSTQSIIIILEDSISLTSSVIGYFNKLILKDKIDISMKIGNEQLMSLLEDLHLTSSFKASLV